MRKKDSGCWLMNRLARLKGIKNEENFCRGFMNSDERSSRRNAVPVWIVIVKNNQASRGDNLGREMDSVWVLGLVG